jgi:hypothetical protein
MNLSCVGCSCVGVSESIIKTKPYANHRLLYIYIYISLRGNTGLTGNITFGLQSHLRCRSAAARLLGLRVRISPEACISDSCDCCVLYCIGRDLCDRQILHPEESYGVCMCVIECDHLQQ